MIREEPVPAARLLTLVADPPTHRADDLAAKTAEAARTLTELALMLPASDVLREPIAALAQCLASRRLYEPVA
jgi:hypothetical protein